MDRQYIVKFTPYRSNLGSIMFRQTKDRSGLSLDGRYQFVIDDKLKDADFWVVQGKGLLQTEECNVAPENTIFLATEPQSVLVYPEKYLSQFGLVSSCQPNTNPKINNILDYPTLPWYIGFTEDQKGIVKSSFDYNFLTKNSIASSKTKLLCVITSDKAFTQGHIDRIDFVKKLKAHYGDQLDVYGRGFRDFDDKWDVLAPYKYHIVIENCSEDYYWTEKLADAYLAEMFPFYSGCSNINDFVPEKALMNIDIFNVEESIKTIDNAIAQNVYDLRQEEIQESKHLMLERYNMFEHIAQLCDRLDADRVKQKIRLEPCKTMSNIHNFFNYTISRNYYKQKHKIKNLVSSSYKILKQ